MDDDMERAAAAFAAEVIAALAGAVEVPWDTGTWLVPAWRVLRCSEHVQVHLHPPCSYGGYGAEVVWESQGRHRSWPRTRSADRVALLVEQALRQR